MEKFEWKSDIYIYSSSNWSENERYVENIDPVTDTGKLIK